MGYRADTQTPNIAGGLVGWAVDSAVGADNKYDDKVHLNLHASPGPAPKQADEEAVAE